MSDMRFTRRIDTWMSEEDASFIDQLAMAEATTARGAMRKLVRLARIQTGQLQPQQLQPAE
jgi:hypothetical protein